MARGDLDKLLKILDDNLKMHSYLVGNQLSLADIAIVGHLHALYRYILEEKYRNVYKNVKKNFLKQDNQK
jgi:glutathione S-transferase